MNQQMANAVTSTKGDYRPVHWVFWVRIAQIVLTVVVLALGSYAASQTWLASGITFSFWAIVWSIIYVPLATWGVPRLSGRYRPMIIILVCECLSVFWWLIAFALLATWSASATFLGFKRMAKRYDTSDIYSTTYSTVDDYVDDYINDVYGNLKAASACTKASTAFAFFNFACFIATLIAISVHFHRHRRQFHQNQQGQTVGYGQTRAQDKPEESV